MSNETEQNSIRQLPAIQRRIINAAIDIDQDDPLAIVYQHSLFCQIALPRSRPKGRTFERAYHNGSVCMEAGKLWNGQKWVEQPLPAGPKPRLALMHINSQAVKTHNPYIDIGHSCAEFLRRLGLNPHSGNTYTLFKREMQALAACRMTLGYTEGGQAVTVNTQPIEEFRAWLSVDDGQPTLWPSYLELSQKYLGSLLEHAVPLDARACGALAHSAMALDIYSFLARRLYALQQPVKVTWHQFHAQFGQEYQDWRKFKQKFITALRAAQMVYLDAKVETVTGGLLLKPSLPPVHTCSVAVSHGLAEQVRQSLATSTPHSLRPATVEQFHTLYPRLDPYVCQSDFDTWLEAKEYPKNYDKAFLGFAKKWAKSKV